MDPVKTVTNALTFKQILTFIALMIAVNALLDIIGGFVPIVPAIIMRPYSTIRGMFTKTAG